MRIGICDDDPVEIVKIRKKVENMHLSDEELSIMEYTPNSLNIDLTEGFFQCEILIMDIYFGDNTLDGQSFDGVDLAKLVNQKYPLCKIVFISQYQDYTEYVYWTDHVFFVLKDHVDQFLKGALQKAVKAYQDDARDKVIEFCHKGHRIWVKLRDIYSIVKIDRNVNVFTDKDCFTSIMSLKQFEEEVKDEPIVRCNSSTLVNIRHIRTISHKKVSLEDNSEYAVNRTYMEKVMNTYMRWWKGRI